MTAAQFCLTVFAAFVPLPRGYGICPVGEKRNLPTIKAVCNDFHYRYGRLLLSAEKTGEMVWSSGQLLHITVNRHVFNRRQTPEIKANKTESAQRGQQR